MDLALAIWQINPAAEYRLNADKTKIEEWRGPGPQPTPDEMQAAWDAYQSQQATAISAKQAADTERTAATTDLRDQYAAAITALDSIIARNGTFTLVQAGQAIDALARVERRILRLLKAQVG